MLNLQYWAVLQKTDFITSIIVIIFSIDECLLGLTQGSGEEYRGTMDRTKSGQLNLILKVTSIEGNPKISAAYKFPAKGFCGKCAHIWGLFLSKVLFVYCRFRI
jgi:hypothetical protein